MGVSLTYIYISSCCVVLCCVGTELRKKERKRFDDEEGDLSECVACPVGVGVALFGV